MQQVFIDLGSHYGAILGRFARSKMCRPGCIFHAFEANPLIPDAAFVGYPVGTVIHREAAGISDENIPLYVNHSRPTIQGSSIYREKTTGDLDKDRPVMIKSIDFSTWLMDLCEGFDLPPEVIIKMNIEGAEYPLLMRMMETGAMHLVDVLRLKTHWKKIGMPFEQHDAIIRRLSQYVNLKVSDSYEF